MSEKCAGHGVDDGKTTSFIEGTSRTSCSDTNIHKSVRTDFDHANPVDGGETLAHPCHQTSAAHPLPDVTTDLEKAVPSPPPSATIPSLSRYPTTVSNPGPEHTYPEGGRAAWLVVLGSFSGMTAGFGLMNSVGTFQAYLSTHQLANYSAGSVSWIFSIYIFLSFFCGIQIGPVFDRYGPRWLIAAGTVCLVGGVLGMANSTEYYHFILSFSIASGIGTSLIFTPAISSVGHYFLCNRGLATGLAATGGSVGGVIFPLILPPLIADLGFPTAMRLLALIMLLLCLVANLLIRSRLPPLIPPPSILPSARIFRSPTFALTTAAVFALEWGLFVPLTYLPSTALAAGLPQPLAYALPALFNAGSVFGRGLPGYVADRLGRFNCMIATVAACLVAALALWLPAVLLPTAADATTTTPPNPATVPLTVAFALLFGFASGSNISLTPVCVGQLCDTSAYGRYYASCYCVVSFGCLTGVPVAGALARVGGSGAVVAFTGACYAVGLGCFVVARGREVGWGLRSVY